MKELDRLRDYIKELAPGGLCVAFSGGVDSAALLAAARELAENVLAVTVSTPLHPKAEPEDAARLARDIGCAHAVLAIEEIPEAVAANTPERCYLCKHNIFTMIKAYAAEHGLTHVLDGTNADDLGEYRPGLRALSELGIKSPLAELGINKAKVREIAAEMGLSVAKKPSTPCLATRFPYHDRLAPERLRVAGEIEDFVRSRGFPIVRARIHGGILRLEIPPAEFAAAYAIAGELGAYCRKLGLDYVTLDLEGFRSGSMDLHVKNTMTHAEYI